MIYSTLFDSQLTDTDISQIHLTRDEDVLPSFPLINARSLAAPGKVDELRLTRASKSSDIFILIESWLTQIHDSSCFKVDGYHVFRADRLPSVGAASLTSRRPIQRKGKREGGGRGGGRDTFRCFPSSSLFLDFLDQITFHQQLFAGVTWPLRSNL